MTKKEKQVLKGRYDEAHGYQIDFKRVKDKKNEDYYKGYCEALEYALKLRD